MDPIEPAEIGQLQELYGVIPRVSARLALTQAGRSRWWPLPANDRRAEAVLIIPRPGRRFVLITKPFYPAGIFRLPSGGVGLDEPVLMAAEREAREETGLAVRPERLLWLVDWTFTDGETDRAFASYLFLFPATDQPLETCDPDEQISCYRECPLPMLLAVANRLRHLPPDWRAWGEHRALPHELAHRSLSLLE